jgi:hypothetical protein
VTRSITARSALVLRATGKVPAVYDAAFRSLGPKYDAIRRSVISGWTATWRP